MENCAFQLTLTNSKPELYQLLINDCMRESRVRMSGLQKYSMRVITSHTQHTCNWLLILQKFPCKASQCTGPHGSQIGAHHLMTLLIVSVGKCAQLVQPHMNTSKYHSYHYEMHTNTQKHLTDTHVLIPSHIHTHTIKHAPPTHRHTHKWLILPGTPCTCKASSVRMSVDHASPSLLT